MERLSKQKADKKQDNSLKNRFTKEREQVVAQPQTRTVR